MTPFALSQTPTNKYRNVKNISVGTMLVVVLVLGASLGFAYEETYQGFNSCGVDGWSCVSPSKNKYEIIYTCPKSNKSARVWVWTARLPSGASIFTVRDCNHLEVHFDCTKGGRSTILRQFNVINVTTLDILPPLLPGLFLHDNDQIPQSPPILNIVDVKHIKLYPGVFDKVNSGGCRYRFIGLSSLTLENVHIDRFMKDLFHNQNMDRFVMKNVVIDELDSNALTIAADTTITGTTFPYIPGNGISLKGETISFINNTFKKIDTQGLTIKTKSFTFSKNHVEEINLQGLEVIGAIIEISNNTFTHLETGAFQKVAPAYSPVSYEIASKFVYNFSDNFVKNINPGSIHFNWEVYKKVCSDIIFKNNFFECSCINLGWMSISNGLGPKITKVKEFYDVYFRRADNGCIGHRHCPLDAVIDRIQDVCNNRTNVSTICAFLDNETDVGSTTLSDDDTVPLSDSIQQSTESEESLANASQGVKEIPALSYAENQTSEREARGFPLLFVVVPAIVLVTAICLGVFMWWYKKKKQRQMVTTLYKNQKGADADTLLVVNELHNELFDKP